MVLNACFGSTQNMRSYFSQTRMKWIASNPIQLMGTSVDLVQVTLKIYFLPALPLLPDQPREDCNVCTEKGKALKPDKQECVVSLEFQQIGRQKPRSLKVQYFRKSGEILIWAWPVQNPTGVLQVGAALQRKARMGESVAAEKGTTGNIVQWQPLKFDSVKLTPFVIHCKE